MKLFQICCPIAVFALVTLIQPARSDEKPAELEVGDKAPEFTSTDDEGHRRSGEQTGEMSCAVIGLRIRWVLSWGTRIRT
jgi:hypothetical protein